MLIIYLKTRNSNYVFFQGIKVVKSLLTFFTANIALIRQRSSDSNNKEAPFLSNFVL